MNRKLIRPNLAEYKEKMSRESSRKRPHPPFETFAENYYYLKQMNKKTPMAISLMDGDIIKGYIEWYDKNCIKINRNNAPNLLIFKNNIKHIYKLEDKKQVETPEKNKKQKEQQR